MSRFTNRGGSCLTTGSLAETGFRPIDRLHNNLEKGGVLSLTLGKGGGGSLPLLTFNCRFFCENRKTCMATALLFLDGHPSTFNPIQENHSSNVSADFTPGGTGFNFFSFVNPPRRVGVICGSDCSVILWRRGCVYTIVRVCRDVHSTGPALLFSWGHPLEKPFRLFWLL